MYFFGGQQNILGDSKNLAGMFLHNSVVVGSFSISNAFALPFFIFYSHLISHFSVRFRSLIPPIALGEHAVAVHVAPLPHVGGDALDGLRRRHVAGQHGPHAHRGDPSHRARHAAHASLDKEV